MPSNQLTDTTGHKRIPHQLDAYARDRIAYRVWILKKTQRIQPHDVQECRAYMTVQLLAALENFDPALSTQRTFVNRVLDRVYRHLLRAIEVRRTNDAIAPVPFSVCEHHPHSPYKVEWEGCGPARRCQLSEDIAAAISLLPESLQVICELLKHHSPRETARQLGIHRSSIYRAIREIRAHFEVSGLGETF